MNTVIYAGIHKMAGNSWTSWETNVFTILGRQSTSQEGLLVGGYIGSMEFPSLEKTQSVSNPNKYQLTNIYKNNCKEALAALGLRPIPRVKTSCAKDCFRTSERTSHNANTVTEEVSLKWLNHFTFLSINCFKLVVP